MKSSEAGDRRIRGLEPVVGPRPRVLILGSIPGVRSLEERRYYVGAGNRFWGVMAELLSFSPELPYDEKVERLTARGIALWDVLQRCEREGSLDANIVSSTEEPNDLKAFLAHHPGIALVVLNGRKAEATLRERVPTEAFPPLVALPSTSGANARVSHEELFERWSVLLPHLERRG